MANAQTNCSKCHRDIQGKYYSVGASKVHSDCFRCETCKCALGGDTGFAEHDGSYYCAAHSSLYSKCAACDKLITDTTLVAGGKYFHSDCFVCGSCRQPIGTAPFYTDGDRFTCQKCRPGTAADAEDLFCSKAGCGKAITDTVVHAMGKAFHPACFACATCHENLGQKEYFILDDQPLCRHDYQLARGLICAKCRKFIDDPQFTVIDDLKYHVQCFDCTVCMQPILKGQGYRQQTGGRNIHIKCENCSRCGKSLGEGKRFVDPLDEDKSTCESCRVSRAAATGFSSVAENIEHRESISSIMTGGDAVVSDELSHRLHLHDGPTVTSQAHRSVTTSVHEAGPGVAKRTVASKYESAYHASTSRQGSLHVEGRSAVHPPVGGVQPVHAINQEASYHRTTSTQSGPPTAYPATFSTALPTRGPTGATEGVPSGRAVVDRASAVSRIEGLTHPREPGGVSSVHSSFSSVSSYELGKQSQVPVVPAAPSAPPAPASRIVVASTTSLASTSVPREGGGKGVSHWEIVSMFDEWIMALHNTKNRLLAVEAEGGAMAARIEDGVVRLRSVFHDSVSECESVACAVEASAAHPWLTTTSATHTALPPITHAMDVKTSFLLASHSPSSAASETGIRAAIMQLRDAAQQTPAVQSVVVLLNRHSEAQRIPPGVAVTVVAAVTP